MKRVVVEGLFFISLFDLLLASIELVIEVR